MNKEDAIAIPTYRTLKCPFCKVIFGYGADLVGKENISCPKCQLSFCYDDGFIEQLASFANEKGCPSLLFMLPICAGFIEMGSINVEVGKCKEVKFQGKFLNVYDVKLSCNDRKAFFPVKGLLISDELTFVPVDITATGFKIISCGRQNEDLLKRVNIDYYVIGRDSNIEELPIWHQFLQNSIELFRKGEFGMVIVQSIATFDVFFDNFLSTQFLKIRKENYTENDVRTIIRRSSRREKLFYYLYYVTGKTFEDSPYNKPLKEIADLRDKIVHAKEENFDEAVLTEENALKAIFTVINSIKCVNDTKH
jgi:hypothetical protein